MFTGHGLRPVEADFFPANVRDGRLELDIDARHQDGVLILEAWSYSRARTAPAPSTGPVELVFDHGVTEGRPVRVEVAPRANVLGLHNEDAERNATVALFGPGDVRIGVYRLAPNETVHVPVTAGPHVVAPLAGDVRVLVDAVPQDFEVHPLETRQVTYPRTVAGSGGRYEQRMDDVDVEGIVFGVAEASVRASEGLACHDGASTRLLAGNETIGVWEAGSASAPLDVAPFLQDELRVVVDGLGPDCAGPAVRLMAYVP